MNANKGIKLLSLVLTMLLAASLVPALAFADVAEGGSLSDPLATEPAVIEEHPAAEEGESVSGALAAGYTESLYTTYLVRFILEDLKDPANPEKCTVLFEKTVAVGESVDVAQIELLINQKRDEIIPEGYRFMGWDSTSYLEVSGTSQIITVRAALEELPAESSAVAGGATPISFEVLAEPEDFISSVYTLTFKVEGKPDCFVHVAEGQLCPVQPLPTVSGKVFTGWVYNAGGTPVPFGFASTTVTEDLTITAQFKREHTVIFMSGNDPGAFALQTLIVADGDTIGLLSKGVIVPHTLVPSGKVFEGVWLRDVGGTAIPFTISSPITESMVLTPQFLDGYYVWFITKSGILDPQMASAASNYRVSNPGAPSPRAGYAFDGSWYIDAACTPGNEFDFTNTAISANTTLYAGWAPQLVNYKVIYWCEKPNFEGDPGTDFANYVYLTAKTQQAPTGTVFAANDASRALGGIERTTVESNYAALKYSLFSTTTEATIAGDGSTIINVFYKRIVYTLIFEVNPSYTATLTVNGVTYGGPAGNGNNYSYTAKFEQDRRNLFPLATDAQRTGYIGNYYWMCKSHQDTGSTGTGNATGSNANGVLGAQEISHAHFDMVTQSYVLHVVPWRWAATSDYRVSKLFYHQATNSELKDIEAWIAAGNTVPLWCDTETIDGSTFRQYVYYYDNADGNILKYYVLAPERLVMNSLSQSYTGFGYMGSLTPGLTTTGLRGNSFGNTSSPWYFLPGNTGDSACSYVPFSTTDNKLCYVYVLFNRLPAPLILVAGSGGMAPLLNAEQQALRCGDTVYVDEVADAIPADSRHVFAGWYLDPDFLTPFDHDEIVPVAGLSLFAKWLVEPHEVRFYSDVAGGTEIVSLASTVADGESTSDPGALLPTEWGRSSSDLFVGWYVKTAGGAFVPYSFEQPITGNLSLYALWDPPYFSYTVSYDFDGGSGLSPIAPVLHVGGSVVVVKDGSSLARNGQFFVGWQHEGSTLIYLEGSSFSMPATDVIFKAVYASSYNLMNISFRQNAFVGDTTEEVWTTAKGATLTYPHGAFDLNFNKTGYSFLGWETTASATAGNPSYQVGSWATHTVDLTLYAVWQPVTQKVIYSANGGVGTMANQSATYGQNLTLNVNAYSRAEYLFGGWNTASNGSGTSYPNGHVFTPWQYTSDLTLYAQWTPVIAPPTVTYTVTYLPGEHGSFVAQTISGIVYGALTPAAPATPGEAGWVFDGWSPVLAATVTGNATYVAEWREAATAPMMFMVRFVDWDDRLIKTEQVARGSNATAPADPTREGYIFTGWDRAYTTVQENITVTAEYTPVLAGTLTIEEPIETGIGTPTINLFGTIVPLFGVDGQAWSLFNLIATLLAVLFLGISALRFALAHKNRDDKGNKDKKRERALFGEDSGHLEYEMQIKHRRLPLLIVSLAIATFAVILFILTQDMRLSMVIFDRWSVVFAIVSLLAVFALILVARTRHGQVGYDLHIALQ